MSENIHWLLSHISEPFQDDLSVGPLAGLAILFLASLLRQFRIGGPMPWKFLAWGLLVAPASVMLSLLLAPLSERAGSVGPIVGMGLVAVLLVAQLAWSIVVVVRNGTARLVLGSGLLFCWWLTFSLATLNAGLLTGFGRTWR